MVYSPKENFYLEQNTDSILEDDPALRVLPAVKVSIGLNRTLPKK
jgi:hypothetical protein